MTTPKSASAMGDSPSAYFDDELSLTIDDMRDDFKAQEISDQLLGIVRWNSVPPIAQQFSGEPGLVIQWKPVQFEDEDSNHAPHRIR